MIEPITSSKLGYFITKLVLESIINLKDFWNIYFCFPITIRQLACGFKCKNRIKNLTMTTERGDFIIQVLVIKHQHI